MKMEMTFDGRRKTVRDFCFFPEHLQIFSILRKDKVLLCQRNCIIIWWHGILNKGFPDGSVGKEFPCSAGDQEMWVQSLDQDDPLQEEKATHSSILAWKSPWTEDPGRLQSTGSQRETSRAQAEHILKQWKLSTKIPFYVDCLQRNLIR